MIRLSRKGAGEEDVVVGFLGFHRQVSRVYNYLSAPLAAEMPIVVAELDRGEVPDFLFFSVFNSDDTIDREHTLPRDPRYDRCVKIFACEENMRPPWNDCHFALTSDRLVHSAHEEQHLRLPNYVNYLFLAGHVFPQTSRGHWGSILKPRRSPTEPLVKKTNFCAFVYSNERPTERLLFYEMLSKYKKVDSGGHFMNNLGYHVTDKCAHIASYKFTIAFENSRYPGYVTEKLLDPMMVGSVPIYWGDRHVGVDFNPKSFVDANEPEGSDLAEHFERVIDRIIYLDTHDDAYDEVCAEPWFANNQLNAYCDPLYTVDFMKKIFERRPP